MSHNRLKNFRFGSTISFKNPRNCPFVSEINGLDDVPVV
jgi:hypothetical protein